MPHRLRLDCKFEVTQIRFFALMWHASDLCHDSVNRKKTHEFRSPQIGYRPLSYVVLNQIWIGFVCMCLQSKQTNRIFQCNASHTSLICDNFAPGDVRLQFQVGALAKRVKSCPIDTLIDYYVSVDHVLRIKHL